MYTTYPDHALLMWAIRHRLTRWTQQLNLAAPIESQSASPTRRLPQRSTPAPSAAPIDHKGVSVLVVYESKRGRAGRAADAVADAAASRGATTLVRTIDEIAPAEVAASDVMFAGCWMPGKTPFGDEPTRRMTRWIETLAPLEGKPVGIFCTYRFFPHTFADMATRTAETERELASRLEAKGARVAAKRSIHFKSIDEDTMNLVERVLPHVVGV